VHAHAAIVSRALRLKRSPLLSCPQSAPRVDRSCRHRGVCAVIGGAEGWEDIEAYGNAQAEWFAEVLDLPHGIPGHETFRRVFSRLDPDELTPCFVLFLDDGVERSLWGRDRRH
jgi:hypothetical protein